MVEPDVHVAGHGGSADVEPILVIGGKLLPRKTRLLKSKKEQPVVGLHQVDPLWHLHLTRPGNVAKCELVKSGPIENQKD